MCVGGRGLLTPVTTYWPFYKCMCTFYFLAYLKPLLVHVYLFITRYVCVFCWLSQTTFSQLFIISCVCVFSWPSEATPSLFVPVLENISSEQHLIVCAARLASALHYLRNSGRA